MTTAQQVENLLKYLPDTRSSDIELLIAYMQKAGMGLSREQIEIFKNLPTPETLTRIRRKLQEQGKYPASKEVNESRYNKFKQYQDPETILEQQGKKVLPWGQ